MVLHGPHSRLRCGIPDRLLDQHEHGMVWGSEGSVTSGVLGRRSMALTAQVRPVGIQVRKSGGPSSSSSGGPVPNAGHRAQATLTRYSNPSTILPIYSALLRGADPVTTTPSARATRSALSFAPRTASAPIRLLCSCARVRVGSHISCKHCHLAGRYLESVGRPSAIDSSSPPTLPSLARPFQPPCLPSQLPS